MTPPRSIRDLEVARIMMRVSREHGGRVKEELPDGRLVHSCMCGAEFTDIVGGDDGDDQWHMHCHLEELKAAQAALAAPSGEPTTEEREGMIRLVREAKFAAGYANDRLNLSEPIADFLLANGVRLSVNPAAPSTDSPAQASGEPTSEALREAAKQGWVHFNNRVRGRDRDYGEFTNADWQAALAMQYELEALRAIAAALGTQGGAER